MEKDTFLKKSRLTGKYYDYFQCVKILNIAQATFYMSEDIFPVDIIISKNKDEKRCLVFYFNKEETKVVYDKWCNYET